MVKYVLIYTKGTLKKDQRRTYQMMLMRFYFIIIIIIIFFFFFSFFFSDLLYKSICCEYAFDLHGQVDVIQLGTCTHNVCLYKEVDKKYTGCNL